MANKQIKDLTAITNPVDLDVLHINEESSSNDRKITVDNFENNLINRKKATNTETLDGTSDAKLITPLKLKLAFQNRVQEINTGSVTTFDSGEFLVLDTEVSGLPTSSGVNYWLQVFTQSGSTRRLFKLTDVDNDKTYIGENTSGGAITWTLVYTQNNPNVKRVKFHNANLTYNRETEIVEITRTGTQSRTLTLSSSGWLEDDLVKLRKAVREGQWTVNYSGGFIFPDGTTDTTLIIPDGTMTGVDLYFDGSDFIVTVLG